MQMEKCHEMLKSFMERLEEEICEFEQLDPQNGSYEEYAANYLYFIKAKAIAINNVFTEIKRAGFLD